MIILNYIIITLLLSGIITLWGSILYRIFLRTFWASNMMAHLEFIIKLVCDHLMAIKIEPAKMVEDSIEAELQLMRKRFLELIVKMLGPKRLKQYIILFGNNEAFVTYIGIKYEMFIRKEVTPMLSTIKVKSTVLDVE